MAIKGQEIISAIKQQIEQYGMSVTMTDVGTVIEVGDGIARIHGLSGCKYNELLEFPNKIMGLAQNLEEDSVSAIIMGDYSRIKEGDEVKTTGRIAEVPVGEALIGRVVDSLGRPLDGKGPIKTNKSRPIERIAPNVVVRSSVNTPVQTGIKAVDCLIPIGRGQRELIIGDRTTGKTSIALDTIVNQKGQNLICIYVAIGQKASKVAQVVTSLEEFGAMDHTIVVAANSSDSAALQYLAPYSGCAMGEEFMESGKDALVIYDDLSKHAWAYRQISLLLRLHSRLLERAAKLAPKYGGGSLTALPIIETQGGDVSAYIPTNVISITDGQIYLEADLFNANIRPALNIGISVSRVGSSAQTKAMKQIAGKLKIDLSQFQALEAFASFGGADLDKATRDQINRGKRIIEILKQPVFSPVPLEKQVTIVYAVTNGYLDDVPVENIRNFETAFHKYMENSYSALLISIASKKELTSESEESLIKAILQFKQVQSF
jgi:F-type H+-transporting ATPase subunit alpha